MYIPWDSTGQELFCSFIPFTFKVFVWWFIVVNIVATYVWLPLWPEHKTTAQVFVGLFELRILSTLLFSSSTHSKEVFFFKDVNAVWSSHFYVHQEFYCNVTMVIHSYILICMCFVLSEHAETLWFNKLKYLHSGSLSETFADPQPIVIVVISFPWWMNRLGINIKPNPGKWTLQILL